MLVPAAVEKQPDARDVINAMKAAKELGAITIALTGSTGGKLAGLANHLLNVPSTNTARIQEMHILIIHLLCERIDDWVLGT